MAGKRFPEDFDRIDKVKSSDKLLINDSKDGIDKYATPSQFNAALQELETHYEDAAQAKEVAQAAASTAATHASNAKTSETNAKASETSAKGYSDSIKDNVEKLDSIETVALGAAGAIESLAEGEKVEQGFDSLPLLAGQPMKLFGNGTPSVGVVPTNWKQFKDGGYDWNGTPSALGQEYINVDATTGGHYIAVRDGKYGLKWLNC